MARAKKALSIPLADPERLERASSLAASAPLPARAGRVEFGTAGWTDETLLASHTFYPRELKKPEERLSYYATHFPFVEVDATYYSLLPPALAERWVSATPAGFLFDVKAFPAFTGHPIDVLRLPKELKAEFARLGHERRVYPADLPLELRRELEGRFLQLVEPLARNQRLGAILLQFPPWFGATRGNVRHIEALREAYPSLPFSVEFRNASWFAQERRERVFDLLSRQRLSFVCVDEPGLPRVVRVTEPSLALARFHGQNASAWSKKGVGVHERFDYLYEPSELAAWVGPLRELSAGAERVHAVFNNCVRNYAVLGAKDLAVLLTSEAAPPDGAPPTTQAESSA